MIFTLKKCPDEPGEWKQWTTECLPWRVMQGLQRNVIGMAFCCKKSVGTSERQLWMDLVPTKSHSNYMGTTVYHGPNVIGLWCRIRTGAAILSEPITRPCSNGKHGWSSNQFLS